MTDDKPDEPQDLRKELNQLWRTTLDQFDEIKNAIVRSSTAGKAKLDATFLRRQRDKLLAELGARVLDAAREGELTLPDKLSSTAQRIQELEEQIREQESEVDRLLHVDDEGEARDISTDEGAPEGAPREAERSVDVVDAGDAKDEPTSGGRGG